MHFSLTELEKELVVFEDLKLFWLLLKDISKSILIVANQQVKIWLFL
jgi:hypothetical protein